MENTEHRGCRAARAHAGENGNGHGHPENATWQCVSRTAGTHFMAGNSGPHTDGHWQSGTNRSWSHSPHPPNAVCVWSPRGKPSARMGVTNNTEQHMLDMAESTLSGPTAQATAAGHIALCCGGKDGRLGGSRVSVTPCLLLGMPVTGMISQGQPTSGVLPHGHDGKGRLDTRTIQTLTGNRTLDSTGVHSRSGVRAGTRAHT